MLSTRALAVPATAAALAVFAATASAAPPLTDAGYWAHADRLQRVLDRYWDPTSQTFSTSSAPLNADALLTYSVAAMQGHHGPTRNDARARALARALVGSPPFVATPPPAWENAQTHAPGFVSDMNTIHSNQHLVIDSEIIDGLRYAWRARQALGLSHDEAAAIADRIHRVALGRFWRWPTIRLNQINWYALVYAANATVTGSPRLLRHDLRLQIGRFMARARPAGRAAGNLGPGLHFNYLPAAPARSHTNVDSAEYANITASFTREYRQARRAGMPAPRAAARRLLRRWLLRVLAGYWTHGGYVNWDTGLGFRRWHQTKKFGLSQLALIGMASAPGLVPSDERRWAKWLLDQGFGFYERQLADWGGIPAGVFFGVTVHPENASSARLALARVISNAARAIDAGLGSAKAAEPPPLYSFDPDTGRLAVTTPAYNTAIVPSSRGSFPYGGIDLARLYDGEQQVSAGIGGRPPASFGLLVRDIRGRRVFASQIPDRGRLHLTRAPRGMGAPTWWNGQVYAGPFRDLRATGVMRWGGFYARTRHRFTRGYVETAWRLRPPADRARLTVDALFPSWGRRTAQVTAVAADGTAVGVGRTRIPLRRIAYLLVSSRRGGYVVVPRTRPPGAAVHLLRPRAQSSAPDPGPTLGVQLLRSSTAAPRELRVRVAPVGDPDRAAEAAARLGAR